MNVTVKVNGELVNGLARAANISGKICLQPLGSVIEFRYARARVEGQDHPLDFASVAGVDSKQAKSFTQAAFTELLEHCRKTSLASNPGLPITVTAEPVPEALQPPKVCWDCHVGQMFATSQRRMR